jgi:hypothetical protein
MQPEYDFILKKYERIRIDQISYILLEIVKSTQNQLDTLNAIKYLAERICLIMLFWTNNNRVKSGTTSTVSRMG